MEAEEKVERGVGGRCNHRKESKTGNLAGCEMEKRSPKIHERDQEMMDQEMGRDVRELTRLGCGRVCTGARLSPLNTPGQLH